MRIQEHEFDVIHTEGDIKVKSEKHVNLDETRDSLKSPILIRGSQIHT